MHSSVPFYWRACVNYSNSTWKRKTMETVVLLSGFIILSKVCRVVTLLYISTIHAQENVNLDGNIKIILTRLTLFRNWDCNNNWQQDEESDKFWDCHLNRIIFVQSPQKNVLLIGFLVCHVSFSAETSPCQLAGQLPTAQLHHADPTLFLQSNWKTQPRL